MNPSTAAIASRLNNLGVNLIESGLYEQAIASFSKGFTVVKKVLSHQGKCTAPLEEPATMENASEPVAQAPSCHFHKMQEATPMEIGETEEPVCSDEPFIFRNPIFIPCHAMDLTCFKYYVKLSFIILYNLALAHHLSGVSGNNTLMRLRKALSLYELAYTIQMTENIELTVLETMAIVNNLGQIHTSLENKEKSCQCFQHLLSTIMFLNDSGEPDTGVEQMDGFILSVMPLILKNAASAPAA
jgi:tetratricopeptide (TPR) repeat protein